ncbi:hypothetical protein [Mesorhizobium sp. Cs1321R2N1]|uniref:hypothetical protein n=1 Tax=Mesorhizobium sp. Cs1321R2N1 TaxID=3015174 RepID=UPI00301C3821
MAEFEQHPRLGQGIGAVHLRLVEQPDQAGIEPVEVADIADQAIPIVHASCLPLNYQATEMIAIKLT